MGIQRRFGGEFLAVEDAVLVGDKALEAPLQVGVLAVEVGLEGLLRPGVAVLFQLRRLGVGGKCESERGDEKQGGFHHDALDFAFFCNSDGIAPVLRSQRLSFGLIAIA